MPCDSTSPGNSSGPAQGSNPYNVGRPGGRDKFPMVRALMVVGAALASLAARHGKRAPLGEPSECLG